MPTRRPIKLVALLGPHEQSHPLALLRSEVRGLVNADGMPNELIRAVRCVVDDGLYISPAFVETVIGALVGRPPDGHARPLLPSQEALTPREREILTQAMSLSWALDAELVASGVGIAGVRTFCRLRQWPGQVAPVAPLRAGLLQHRGHRQLDTAANLTPAGTAAVVVRPEREQSAAADAADPALLAPQLRPLRYVVL